MRQVIIHQSLNRSPTVLGGDRELVLTAAFIAVLLGLGFRTWWGIGIALAFWFASVAILHQVYKADPFMRRVALRHLRYAKYYPAKSGLHTICPSTATAWA
jgi:type IV secretion system protein VirB3